MLKKIYTPLALAVALAILSSAASAQTPFPVFDINTRTSAQVGSSSPQGFVAAGDAVYFAAKHPDSGTELWKVVNGQASLVADVYPGPLSSAPQQLVALREDLVVFTAASPSSNGRDLWATDGTTAGTRLVRDINPITDAGIVFRNWFDGKLYFVANDGVNGLEPWVSDGTEAGTKMLVNLDGTSASSTVQIFGSLQGQALIFSAGGLWTSDGTPEGTTSVLAPGTLGVTAGFASVGSVVYFTATASAGRELWKTDGTAAGTVRIKDIATGTANGIFSTTSLVVANGLVYFIANETESAHDLWKSDGTDAGTQRVASALVLPGQPNSQTLSLFSDGDTVYVWTNRGLWSSDGTSAGTYLLHGELTISRPVVAFGGLYYSRSGSTEIWATNGTPETTRLIHQFEPNTRISSTFFSSTGGRLYFTGWDALHGDEPWVCADGEGNVVERLANIYPDAPASSYPTTLTAAGNLLFFKAMDENWKYHVWRTDGTPAGTFRLASEGGAGNESWTDNFVGWAGNFYFRRGTSQLWRSDGTDAGTALLRDFHPGASGAAGSVEALFSSSGFLYMTVEDGNRSMLWRSDGTLPGTIDLGSGKELLFQPSSPGSLAELSGRIYASAGLPSGIFTTEGTVAATRRATLFPSGEGAASLVTGAGTVFVVRTTANEGQELWSTDGTSDGTVLVKDIRPGTESSQPQQLVGSSRYVFFVANDGTHGQELWRSDGTEAGTILLRDIRGDAASATLTELTINHDVLYFVVDDGIAGTELWKSDGTPAGTVMVADIRAGAESSAPQKLMSGFGSLWFSADDGVHGRELWRTTDDGVVMVADIEPGAGSSHPGKAVHAGELLYFTAFTTTFGEELWALDGTSLPIVSISDARVIEGNSGTKTVRFTVSRSGNTSASSTVTFSTSDLSATAGSDYVARTGTITFDPGATTQFVDVTINGDTASEKSESFLLNLTDGAGAFLGQTYGTGVIEDDDRTVQLGLEWLSTTGSSHSLRLTNHGSSSASNVIVTFSQSPGKFSLSVREHLSEQNSCTTAGNPTQCLMRDLAPGVSILIDAGSFTNTSPYVDPLNPPGTTVTVDVRAAETDTNLADNRVSRMVGAGFDLPSYLTNGVATSGTYRLASNHPTDSHVAFQSSPVAIVCNPTSAIIPGGTGLLSFTVTPHSYLGRARLTSVWFNQPRTISIFSVQPGAPAPKLDVAVVSESSLTVTYGNPVEIQVEIAAVLNDGTRPTGTVTLVDSAGATIAQQTLVNGATTFQRTGLPPGVTQWKLNYSGDANFNAIAGAPVSVTVTGMPTGTAVELPYYFCAGEVDVVVRVRSSSEAVPTGTVKIFVQDQAIATIDLVPSGVAGEAFATLRHTFAASNIFLSAQYQPSSTTFKSSSDGDHYNAVTCAPFNLVASANGSNVSLTWAAQAGAHHYDVFHTLTDQESWVFIGSTQTTQYAHVNPYQPRVALYHVRAVDVNGSYISHSAPDIVYTKVFTDDPIVARQTVVKSLHIDQLQEAALSLRTLVEWGATTMPPAAPGTSVRAARIVELRHMINQYRQRLGLPAVTFTDPALSAGSLIKGVHVQELRNALK